MKKTTSSVETSNVGGKVVTKTITIVEETPKTKPIQKLPASNDSKKPVELKNEKDLQLKIQTLTEVRDKTKELLIKNTEENKKEELEYKTLKKKIEKDLSDLESLHIKNSKKLETSKNKLREKLDSEELKLKGLIPEKVPEKQNLKKERIPQAVRGAVWDTYIGREKGIAPCFCCHVNELDKLNFQAGHVIAEALGGKVTVENLRPICASCNTSMGITNMEEFMKKFSYNKAPPTYDNVTGYKIHQNKTNRLFPK